MKAWQPLPAARIEQLRTLAAGMRSYAPISAQIVARITDDIESGGDVARAISGHPDWGTPLFATRALAGVHWLILAGLAPDMEQHFRHHESRRDDPAWCDELWNHFRAVVLGHPREIRAALDRPVQQHQPGRAATLLNGLSMLAAPKVQLLELGACAGLNLLVDRYWWFGDGWQWGDENSPVRLATRGRRPGQFEIVDRAGCDLAPRDAGNAEDAMVLRSCLPIERDINRMELDDALALAATDPGLTVDKADAVEWLAQQMRERPRSRHVYTVVWHSLFWGFLSPQQQHDIERIMDSAARNRRLAHISYEPVWAWSASRLRLTVYS
ncbi:DUF2332 domain-containing protein [Micromonospora sp. NPDC050276]|uniref:DUF2332 domain-containing protein n=1 Tax=Micromonospora sp. NPDC050276 TaxID=3364278 RepID=UPI0037BA1791